MRLCCTCCASANCCASVVALAMSLEEIPRLAMLVNETLTPPAASEASICASGLSVTTVEDAGASADVDVDAAVLPEVAAAPDVPDALDVPEEPPRAWLCVCAADGLMDETDIGSSV